MQEPSAYLTTPRSSDTGRSSSGARRLGRMKSSKNPTDRAGRACRRGRGQRQGSWRGFSAPDWSGTRGPNACLSPASRIDKLGSNCEGLECDSPRSDRPDRAACRACPAQRAFAGYFSSNRRKLSGDRRAGRLAQHFAPDRITVVAGLGPQRDVGSRAARPDLCAAYLGRAAADRTRAAFLRR
ncbi:hypothetical protein chiPu_0031326, partial [Chiloscyllium punctatum]|nr:hypothetical protein [Chiloscyllium punctatum]